MTRRNFSKILVILIVLPIAVRAWQRFSSLDEPAPVTAPGEPQMEEAMDLPADAPAKPSDDE